MQETPPRLGGDFIASNIWKSKALWRIHGASYHLSWCCHKTMNHLRSIQAFRCELKALVSGRVLTLQAWEWTDPVLKTRNSNRKQLPASWVSPASSCFCFLEPVWWEVAGVKCLHHWSLTCFNWRSKPGKGECCWKPGFSGSASLKLSGCNSVKHEIPVFFNTKILVLCCVFFFLQAVPNKTLLMDSEKDLKILQGFLAQGDIPKRDALYLE